MIPLAQSNGWEFLCSERGAAGRSGSRGPTMEPLLRAGSCEKTSRGGCRRGSAGSSSRPATRNAKLLVGLAGLILGAIACLVLAVVEIGAWALVHAVPVGCCGFAGCVRRRRDARAMSRRSRPGRATDHGWWRAGSRRQGRLPPGGRSFCCTDLRRPPALSRRPAGLL